MQYGTKNTIHTPAQPPSENEPVDIGLSFNGHANKEPDGTIIILIIKILF
jgi:hypothetical protein